MIVKELDELVYEDRFSQAGYEAEKQLAYYLKHKFHADENILIINNLRFRWLDAYNQIDHLIIHEFGIIIVESKSVSSKVKYNAREEWNRLWDNSWKAMNNPVKQAERQGDAIKTLLRDNCEILLGKLFGIKQKGFRFMPVDCIVAISDSCDKIERPAGDPYADIVVKADLVTDRICLILETLKKRNSVFSKEYEPWKMSLEETIRVKDFLLKQHEPFKKNKPAPQQQVTKPQIEYSSEKPIEKQIIHEKVAESPVKYSSDKPIDKPVIQKQPAKSPEHCAPKKPTAQEEKIHALLHCPKCKGDVTILWGNTHKNYYWHCRSCGENTGINYKCPVCQHKLRVRKQAKEYFIYCEPCKLEALYHTEK